MPNKNVFCHSPWFELQIYWDGSYGFCCQEERVLYPDSEIEHYNVANMSIREWMDSDIMRKARLMMFDEQRNKVCRYCYTEEDFGASSRRHRCNSKSVIFTKSNFDESYEQSPNWPRFEMTRLNGGAWDRMPIDLHIDLGNFCNLTCKMCGPRASSSIATQYVKWGMKEAKKYVGSNWTKDDVVWNRVLTEIADTADLKNVHFMGGETLLTPRFEDFVDFMTARGRFDIGFSFVNNGTTFNARLLEKLKRFRRVGLELSIESITEHNSYQRQGTDTPAVLENIQRYLTYCNGDNITLTVRPAISALTIGTYHTLLRYCLENQIIVKALLVVRPEYLDVRILPDSVRQAYKENYYQLIRDFDLDNADPSVDYNESDIHQLGLIIRNQINQALELLDAPRMPDSEQLLDETVAWCKKWDAIHKYDALKLYPELREEFISRGY